jgi:hypothetical protein
LERSPILGFHPIHQHVFEGFGIDLLEQPSEGSLRGHVIFAGPTRAWAATQAAALSVVEALGELSDRVRLFAASRHRQSDQG